MTSFTTRDTFTDRALEIIRNIPPGRVLTYGAVAALAGNRRAARQVARVLHSCSRKEELPWHRVVNRQGRISLKPLHGYEEQLALLETEGVEFEDGAIDLDRYLWRPGSGR